MEGVEPAKQVLGYADRETDSSFQCDGGMIYIHNRTSREQAYLGWAVAGVMILLLVVCWIVRGRPWPWVADPLTGVLGMVMYLLAVFCLIGVGLQWSTIRVDLQARRIERRTRWGPFAGRVTAPLDVFDRVKLRDGSEEGAVVELVGRGRMEIVSYRGRTESLRMAQLIAARLSLPVEFAE